MDKQYLKEMGERIRARREELGMSQLDLALKIGYKTKQAISKIEQGERSARVDKFTLLSDALGVPISYLMGDAERQELIDEIVDELKTLPDEAISSLLQTVRNLKNLS